MRRTRRNTRVRELARDGERTEQNSTEENRTELFLKKLMKSKIRK